MKGLVNHKAPSRRLKGHCRGDFASYFPKLFKNSLTKNPYFKVKSLLENREEKMK